ncbi:MAG: ATP-binding protein, partial [Nitrospira sp.]|nr:ATP-binding protein [Nitrospira sp.]
MVETEELKKLSLEDVQQILESGEFDSLIGTQEDDHLECKGEPYQLDINHAKLEFAKDVSALANAKGGIILIGVRT